MHCSEAKVDLAANCSTVHTFPQTILHTIMRCRKKKNCYLPPISSLSFPQRHPVVLGLPEQPSLEHEGGHSPEHQGIPQQDGQGDGGIKGQGGLQGRLGKVLLLNRRQKSQALIKKRKKYCMNMYDDQKRSQFPNFRLIEAGEEERRRKRPFNYVTLTGALPEPKRVCFHFDVLTVDPFSFPQRGCF